MRRSVFFIVALLTLLPISAGAETAEEKGLAVAVEAGNRAKGFGDYTATLRMVLKNRNGQESFRNMRIRTLEVAGDGDKSLSIFDDPKDVRGTALLTHAHKIGDDDQWLYLPALKRVKRINSRNRSGSFMGSEFAYEDIVSREVEKYTHRWITDELLGGRQCHVIDSCPVDEKNTGYTRLRRWVDTAYYRILKIEYYDRKDSLLKTLTVQDYRQYLEQYWYPDKMHMENHRTGKSTTLYWTEFRFRIGLRDADFNQNSLKRAK